MSSSDESSSSSIEYSDSSVSSLSYQSTDESTGQIGMTSQDRECINEIVDRYGYQSESQSEASDENLFESVSEEWEKSGLCLFDDPQDVLRTLPVSYLYSYFDSIQSTMFKIFGESNIYNSECVQVFDNTYIDHEVLFIDYADKDKDYFIVGFKHDANNSNSSEYSRSSDDQRKYCVGMQIIDSQGESFHRECSCEKYGEMEYIKIPILIVI